MGGMLLHKPLQVEKEDGAVPATPLLDVWQAASDLAWKDISPVMGVGSFVIKEDLMSTGKMIPPEEANKRFPLEKKFEQPVTDVYAKWAYDEEQERKEKRALIDSEANGIFKKYAVPFAAGLKEFFTDPLGLGLTIAGGAAATSVIGALGLKAGTAAGFSIYTAGGILEGNAAEVLNYYSAKNRNADYDLSSGILVNTVAGLGLGALAFGAKSVFTKFFKAGPKHLNAFEDIINIAIENDVDPHTLLPILEKAINKELEITPGVTEAMQKYFANFSDDILQKSEDMVDVHDFINGLYNKGLINEEQLINFRKQLEQSGESVKMVSANEAPDFDDEVVKEISDTLNDPKNKIDYGEPTKVEPITPEKEASLLDEHMESIVTELDEMKARGELTDMDIKELDSIKGASKEVDELRGLDKKAILCFKGL